MKEKRVVSGAIKKPNVFKRFGNFVVKELKSFKDSFLKVWKLLKLLLNNRFPSGRFKDIKSVFITIVKYVAIFGGISFVLWFIFNRIVIYLNIGIDTYLFSICLALIFVVSLISSVSSILTNMFMSKDNEILISLPVSFKELFVSKLIYLYINELIFNILYVGPIFVCIGIIGRVSVYSFISYLLFFPILPIASLGVGALISIPVMFFVRFLKDHNKTSIVLSLLAIAGLFALYMFLITNVSGAFNITEQQLETMLSVTQTIRNIGSSIPVFYWVSSAFFSASTIWKIYVFMGGAIVLLLATLPLIRRFYQKIAIFNNETKKDLKIRVDRKKFRILKKELKLKYSVAKKQIFAKFENASNSKEQLKIELKDLKKAYVSSINNAKEQTKIAGGKYIKRSPFKELFINEFRTCLRSPSLITQYFLFTILTPLIVFTYDKLLFTIVVNQTGTSLIFASHVLVVMMLTILSSSITSVAISRQGGLLYISKMMPISYEKQAFAKILFNVVITWAAIIISTIITCIFSTANPLLVVVCSIAAMFVSIGHVCQSYDQDLRDPSIDWYDVSEISSLSKNTTKTMLYGFLLAVIFTVLTIVGGGNVWLTAILLIVPAILYAYGRLRIIRIRLKYLFDELEI